MDVFSDYERFRGIVRERVEYRLLNEPDDMHSHWVIACYQSVDVFKELFPDEQRRRNMICHLATSAAVTRIAVSEAIAEAESVLNGGTAELSDNW